jgi:hypothetical protein
VFDDHGFAEAVHFIGVRSMFNGIPDPNVQGSTTIGIQFGKGNEPRAGPDRTEFRFTASGGACEALMMSPWPLAV